MVRPVRSWISLLIFTGLFASTSTLASSFEVRSLREQFSAFAQASKGATFESQLAAWKAHLEKSEPKAYWHILGRDTSSQDSIRRERAELHFKYILENAEHIDNNFSKFESNAPQLLAELTSILSVPPGRKVRVLALPSLLKFNGQVTTIDGIVYVMFGMDMIAKIESSPDFTPGSYLVNDIPVLVAHEFFHSIHTYANPNDDLLDALWKEGLAQVVSQVFVPGSHMDSVFMDKELTSRCHRDNLETWAKEFLADLDSGQNDKKYGKWFLFDGLESLGVNRAGYCIGYHAVVSLLDRYSVRELMGFQRQEIDGKARLAIEKLARPAK